MKADKPARRAPDEAPSSPAPTRARAPAGVRRRPLKGAPRQGMNLTEYAKHRGCSVEAVRKAKVKGWTVHHPDGSINPALSDVRWVACASPTNGGKHADRDTTDPDAVTNDPATLASVIAHLPAELRALPHPELRRLLDAAKVELTRIAVETASMERDRKAGTLLLATDLVPVWADVISTIRSRVRSVPASVADEVVNEARKDPADTASARVRSLLEKEYDAALAGVPNAYPR